MSTSKNKYFILLSFIAGILVCFIILKAHNNQLMKYNMFENKVRNLLKYQEKISCRISYIGNSPRNIISTKLSGLNLVVSSYIGYNHISVLTDKNKESINAVFNDFFPKGNIQFTEYRVLSSIQTSLNIENDTVENIFEDPLAFLDDLDISEISGYGSEYDKNKNIILTFYCNKIVSENRREEIVKTIVDNLILNNIFIEEKKY